MTTSVFQKLNAPDTPITLDDVQLRPMILETEDTPFGFGIVEFGKGSVPFELTYDEILYCLDGSLTIVSEGEDILLVAGEALWMGANRTIVYEVPEAARLLYVTRRV